LCSWTRRSFALLAVAAMGLGEWLGLTGTGDKATAPPDWADPLYWLAHPRHHPDRVAASLPTEESICSSTGGGGAADEDLHACSDGAAAAEDVQRERRQRALPAGAWSDCQETAPGDVFFLHGTMEGWGNRASINRYESEEWSRFNTRHQMTMVLAFTGSCRAYAPLYRQAAAMGDWDLAYQDVLSAFEHFLTEVPEARPLILAGHSQGSLHLARLVKERVATDEKLLARVAGIYAPGMAHWIEPSPLPLEDGLAAATDGGEAGGQAAKRVPMAAVWATVAPDAKLGWTLVGHMAKGEPLARFANPGLWAEEGEDLGVLLPGARGEPMLYHGLIGPSAITAADGLLRLSPAPDAEAAFQAALKINGGGRDYHAWDIHLFWGNIRRRVDQQVCAYLARKDASEARSTDPGAPGAD